MTSVSCSNFKALSLINPVFLVLVINVTAHSHVVPFKLVTWCSDSFLCWSPLYVQCKIWILKQNQPRTTNLDAVRQTLLKKCQCFGFEYVLSHTFLIFDCFWCLLHGAVVCAKFLFQKSFGALYRSQLGHRTTWIRVFARSVSNLHQTLQTHENVELKQHLDKALI